MPHPRWASRQPAEGITRSPSSRAARVAEQDEAAGGAEQGKVRLNNGRTATASVQLLRERGGLYATLRFKAGDHTNNLYFGKLDDRRSRRRSERSMGDSEAAQPSDRSVTTALDLGRTQW